MKKTNLILTILFLLSGIFLHGQEDKELIVDLLENDRSSIDALVMYPEETRNAILEASLYPDGLIKLQLMQEKTSDRFYGIMEGYSKATQEQIWDLTRYPGLIEKLISEGKNNRVGFKSVLEEYPDKVYENGMDAANNNYNLLQQIDELQYNADRAFETFITNYPVVAQQAFQELVQEPEVLSILTENIRLTIIVGNLYKNDPVWVRHKADSMSLALARQQASDLADWQESIENNPEAREELVESAEMFAEEYGYDDMSYDFDQKYDDVYYDETEEVVVVEHHYYYHYPYWFGYPRWYIYPRWRPYPFWYEWGFYIRPGGRIVVFGFPSFYFSSWYFYYPYHHYYYPHLSDHFVNYYYGHRHSSSSITVSVNTWKDRNRDIVGDEWLASPENRVNRLREFGRFEKERIEYNNENPQRALSQKEYLERNPTRYNRLKEQPAFEDRKVERKQESQLDVRKEPTVQPPRKEGTERTTPKERIIIKPSRKEKSKEELQRNPRKIERGKELHEQQWNQQKRTQRVYPQRQRIDPKPQRTPSKQNIPTQKQRKTTPKKRGGG